MNNAGLCTLSDVNHAHSSTYYSTSSGLLKLARSKRLRRATPHLRLRPRLCLCQHILSLHPTYDVTLIRVIHGDVLTCVMHDNVFENNIKLEYKHSHVF